MRRLFLALLFFCTTASSIACCGLGLLYSNSARVPSPVAFSGQTNFIVWDKKTQVEHFVRTANFETSASEFDFIAPTPSKPSIAAVSERVFEILQEYVPSSLADSQGSPSPGGQSGSSIAANSSTVRVVNSQKVGAYDAVTLLATNSSGLQNWLKTRGYKLSEDQSEWLAYYVKKGWYLTAFRYKSKGKFISSETIRMTFKTATPFCPYYVPPSNLRSSNSQLRLFLLTREPVRATLGESQDWHFRPTNVVPFVNSQVAAMRRALHLSPNEIFKDGVVTLYDSAHFDIGAKEDLFFKTDTRKFENFAAFLR